MTTVTPDDIQEGFAHLNRFAAIHYGTDPAEANEAIRTLAEYLGMDEEGLQELVSQANEYVPVSRNEAVRWVIMGFLIGMTTVQRGIETR